MCPITYGLFQYSSAVMGKIVCERAAAAAPLITAAHAIGAWGESQNGLQPQIHIGAPLIDAVQGR
jgi:hypothetical protein